MSKSDLTRAREMVNYFSKWYFTLYKFRNYTTVDIEILMRMLISNLDRSPLAKLKRYVTFILYDEAKTKDVLTYYANTDLISNPADDDIKSYFNQIYSKFCTFKESSYYPVMQNASDLTGVKELDEYVNIAMYLCLNVLSIEEIKRDKEKLEKKYLELQKINNTKENKNNHVNYVDDSAANVAINAALTISTMGMF